MDAPVESITINSLNEKLDSKAGFSNKKKKLYRRLMTEALLSEGMTEQNQVRFCNAFVATGIDPIVKLLNSEKGKDWKTIIQLLMKQPYFLTVVRMKLRFFMQLLSESIHGSFKDSSAILFYSIKNIVYMEFDSKKRFRGDNIVLFREIILNCWGFGKAISKVSDIKAIEQLRNYVLRCLAEDKKGTIKCHPAFKPFWTWMESFSPKDLPLENAEDKNRPDAKPEENNSHTKETTKETFLEKETKLQESSIVVLEQALDLFEQRIVERDTAIKELRNQVNGLKEQIKEERQATTNMKDLLTAKLKKEKQEHGRKCEEFDKTINSLQETLKEKEQLINEQTELLKEREGLLKDNDMRFETYYKQQMVALGNKLKLSFSDLTDSINDVSDDEKEFLEVPLLDIVKTLKKEGVEI